ncbi:MAG: hypothetical protein IKN43_00475, partial [Selenomonadaceae bacterium]|nr:hypothetical protein [Selenomonadaceae bacterium]
MAKETLAEMAEYDTGTISALKDSGLYIEDDLTERVIPEDVLALVDREFAITHRILPLERSPYGLLVVTDSTKTIKRRSVIDENLKQVGYVEIALTGQDNLQSALVKFYKFSSEDRRNLMAGV